MLNECTRNGKYTKANGKAKVVDKTTNAKLKVTFFWPFYGDYWIIKLGEAYDYAVVGTLPKVSLDIEQNTQMDNALLSQIIEFVKSNGFDVENLIKTSHS